MKKCINNLIVGAMVLNIILIAYVAFFKNDALWLETLKAGGKENFQLVQQLYSNDAYKNQQREAIQQAATSFANANTANIAK